MPPALSRARLVWCVRTAESIREHRRAGELLTQPVAGNLVAFVAEQLPDSFMRGVPRGDLGDIPEAEVRAAADAGVERLFGGLVERIRADERGPRDGWRFSGDPLFAGSVLLLPALLATLADRAGGDVLLATPDRGLALALPAARDRDGAFQRMVVRAWRDALNPCSRAVLRCDGARLEPVPTRAEQRAAGLLARLRR